MENWGEAMDCIAIERSAESIRLSRSLTYEQVAELVDAKTGRVYSVATIKNFFAGKTANPNMQTVIDVLAALDANLSVITEISENAINENDVEHFRDIILRQGEDIERLTVDNRSLEADRNEHRQKHDDLFKENAALSAQVSAQLQNIKWLRVIVTVLSAVIVLALLCVFVLCIIDMSNTDVGWFRSALAGFRVEAAAVVIHRLI